jgi:hypothetical protein
MLRTPIATLLAAASVLVASVTWAPAAAAATSAGYSADWNGDGAADVVAPDLQGRLWLYPGDGTGGFGVRSQLGTGWTKRDQIRPVGNWDGSAGNDLIARDPSNGDLWLYAGNGTGGFTGYRVIGRGWQVFREILGVGDFSGDGRPDIVAVRQDTGALMLYPGNGSGGFQAARQIGTGWQVRDALASTGDWNGDGTADFLARDTRNGSLILYAGNGSGGFATIATIGSGWYVFTAIVGVGDWSGDGPSDLLVRNAAGDLLLYRGNGTGGFAAPFPKVGGGWNGISLNAPVQPAWLTQINRYRVASGLVPVTSNPLWVTGLLRHFTYLANTPYTYLTGQYANLHLENPASPYYTPEGALEGGRSNLAMSSGAPATSYIDGWLAAPFHAIGILRPGLTQVAFASANGYSGLDVTGGLQYQAPTQPILFPGPGMTTNLRTYGGEMPSPLQTCGWTDGLGTAYGLPLIAMLPATPQTGMTASLTGPGGTVQSSANGRLCIVNQHTYRTTDTVYGPTGAQILTGDRAVLLIPRSPLVAGLYQATITQPTGSPITWSFRVS